ncbi:uncharacterized protein LOC112898143 [Panicum hallii]|uniref:uncharacterized protein LOC112898143 n=1 Tax=Panicum hallii TaxID=206008 RepID=UPI000DF4DCE7|nr:uncharacterized protein LOC112898143 [Panicum hallii]
MDEPLLEQDIELKSLLGGPLCGGRAARVQAEGGRAEGGRRVCRRRAAIKAKTLTNHNTGYLEVAHVQYYDADLKSFPVVNTDQGYGHHWPSCKKGNPEDIAALLAVRGPPKKKRKTTKASTEESIVLFMVKHQHPL